MIYPIGKGACWKICRKAIYNYQAKLFIDNSLLSIGRSSLPSGVIFYRSQLCAELLNSIQFKILFSQF